MRLIVLAAGWIACSAAAFAAVAADVPAYDPAEALPGGVATAMVNAPDAAFSRPHGNLPEAERERFDLGQSLFYRRWIAGPAPAPALTGLGPLFNALSCQQCHVNEGRGRPPAPFGRDATSFVLKLEPPHGLYGDQIQDRAVGAFAPEGRVVVNWREVEKILLPGDLEVSLRRPVWQVAEPAHGPLAPDRLSGRIAPAIAGAGLLEAVPAADVAAVADPEDLDGDGVSGVVPAGRFGWRGEFATLADQSAHAFSVDMGISTDRMPDPTGDCRVCPGAKVANVEAVPTTFGAVAFYVANLGAPARSYAASPDVLRGREVFYEAGCADCHRPSWKTSADAPEWIAGQTIWPYTDLLSHDMGEGLADAGSAEWRTPPLWGFGRHVAVNGNGFYLHDGRARSPIEAILWHGGEALASRDKVKALSVADRQALLIFLNSL